MDIAIIGAGSLGSVIGGLLARDHDVTLVGREEHMAAVETAGLQLVGQVERTVEPTVRTDLDGLTADLGLVTVKSYDTPTVAEQLTAASIDTVISLQNGMGNESILHGAIGDAATVLAGTATYGARKRTPGVVAVTGIGTIAVGPREPTDGPAADRARTVARALNTSDLSCRYVGKMQRRLWVKLAINAGINPVTAMADCRNGALVNGPAREIAIDAATETAAVARANGIDLADETVRLELATVIENTAHNRSSMAVDCSNGRRTEIDAINGYVAEHATAATGAPVNRTLWTLVRTWEYVRGLRSEPT